MIFSIHDTEHKYQNNYRIVYIYENGKSDQKPFETKLYKKKTTLKELARILKFTNLRLYNSQGSQCFEQDLDFIKAKAVLYASRGEQFDPASCFAEYQMIKQLGEGGFGKVYLAKHKQTGQNFAIKIIKTENIGSVGDIDSIFVEAEILKSLKHPNIVNVHKCLTLKNMEVVIIMQYLQGGQLFNFVSKAKRLDQDTAKGFIRQIAKGMLYCHQNNLTHRDLKLQNLLLVNSEQNKIKIIDFGIAGAISTIKWQDLDTGSLGYMAPECFVNQKNQKFDGRLDVWSTGVILFCMLVGQLPFKKSEPYETIQSIKEGKYKIPSSIQKELSIECLDVLRGCLDVNPKTRMTMQQLSDHPWISKNIFHSPSKMIEYQPIYDQIIEDMPQLKQIENIQPKMRPAILKASSLAKKDKESPMPNRIKLNLRERQKKRFK